MESFNEIVSDEGKINIIPKKCDISLCSLTPNIPKETSKVVNKRNIFTLKRSINKKLKSFSSNSTASTTINNEKIKKVTFSTLSIIKIKSYKKFNKFNTYKIDDNRNNCEKSEICDIF